MTYAVEWTADAERRLLDVVPIEDAAWLDRSIRAFTEWGEGDVRRWDPPALPTGFVLVLSGYRIGFLLNRADRVLLVVRLWRARRPIT